MRRYILLFLVLAFSVTCEKEDTLPVFELCDDEYFYYSGGSKIFLKHSVCEVLIEFKRSDITEEKAKSHLKKFSFLNTDHLSVHRKYDRLKAIFNEKCDCNDFRYYLQELNKDSEIYSATPVFYFSDNDPDSYVILLSEVLTAIDENFISETDFLYYVHSLNLESVESQYSSRRFHLKVKEVNTGFEALGIANQIYEHGKVRYSHPNFIARIVLH